MGLAGAAEILYKGAPRNLAAGTSSGSMNGKGS